MHRSVRSLLMLSLLLAGCVGVPFDYPKSPTTPTTLELDSGIGEFAQAWVQAHGEESGFIALPGGNDALGARLKLIEGAQHTIDAQYFLIKPDQAGGLFVGKLLRAADRGVQVRLLIDDIFSPGVDSGLALFNSHPNVQVRLFNPLSRSSGKYWNMLWDFKRANRRMHNKSFVVDGGVTIIGGRNIADEYFEIKPDVEFDDFELMALGPVVPEVIDAFEVFWESDLAVPIEAFEFDFDAADMNRWRQEMEAVVAGAADSVYERAINSQLLQEITSDIIVPLAAPAHVVTDSPKKLQQAVGDENYMSLASELQRYFDAAECEIVIITPYFVPQKSGVEIVEAWLARGLRVVVITNSLASTNHVPVHSGHKRYRKRLLKAGVEFYEIKVDAIQRGSRAGSEVESLTLHTKAVVVDREMLFIGSLNFDPRSIQINTEMGVFIDSQEIAQRFFDGVSGDLAETTYTLSLNDKGKVLWSYEHGEESEEWRKEPQTSTWRRFAVWFYGLLPIESQL